MLQAQSIYDIYALGVRIIATINMCKYIIRMYSCIIGVKLETKLNSRIKWEPSVDCLSHAFTFTGLPVFLSTKFPMVEV